MLFLISLAIALAFVLLCGKALRTHPAPFYIAAAVLSICAVLVTNLHPAGIPAFLNQYVLAQLTKGTLATACWAIVMWTGALPNSSPLMKRFMPVRGQLSIFAAILTLGHAVGFGISFIPRWFQQPDALNLVICAVLMLIMIPLAIMSVRKIRSKMKPKVWKSWQRLAYVFYVFIPLHVYALNLSKARHGRDGAWFSLMVYTVVFAGWAVFRLRKLYVQKKKPEKKAVLNIGAAAACALVVGATGFLARAEQTEQKTELRTAEITDPADNSDSENAVTTALAAITTAPQETGSASGPEPDQTTGTTAASDAAGSADTTANTTAAEAGTEDSETPQEQADTPAESPAAAETSAAETPAAPQEEAPAPVQTVYQNGTFRGTAYGYDGDITVSVTIQDDRIVSIDAETGESDDSYFLSAKSSVISQILDSQQTSVDAVSGATYSSKGIMTAVQAALDSAKN